MSLRSLIFSGCSILILVFSAGVGTLSAQSDSSSSADPGAAACRSTVEKELAKEQRLYRSVLLGHPKAKDALPGEVRYDKDGNTWIKTKDNEWSSVAKGHEGATQSDSGMDGQDEMSERRGIIETRGVLTSDLVPYFTQAFRALQCRTEFICGVTAASIVINGREPTKVKVTAPGCFVEERDSYPACQLVSKDDKTKTDEGDVRSYCQSIEKDFLNREEDLLKLIVEYDAAYRSLLQLSGSFDLFLESWKWSISHTLKESAGIFGFFQRIPCFIASCDESPRSSSATSGP